MEGAGREFKPNPTTRNFDLSLSSTPFPFNTSPMNHHMENQLFFNMNDWSEDIPSWTQMQNPRYLECGEILEDGFNRLNLGPLTPQRVLFDRHGMERSVAVSDGRGSLEYQQLQRMIMLREKMMTGVDDRFRNLSIAAQIFRPNRERVNPSRRPTTSSLNDFGSCFNVRRSSTRDGVVKISNPMNSTPAQNFSMQDMKGRVLLGAKDQYGCRLLQEILEKGLVEDIDMIYFEVKDHFHELMVDQFGNYLVQKILEISQAERMSDILASIVGDQQRFAQVCLDIHGTRVVQKLLEFLQTSEQITSAISAIKPITVALIKSVNGGHVIQQCLNLFTFAHTKHLLDVVVENCLDLATDKRGCCTLQHCLSHARGEAVKRLVHEIIGCSLVLSQNPYGNYVVQYIVGLKITHITQSIIVQLLGRYIQLSMDKFGSNVVEVLLRNSLEEHVEIIVLEISNSNCFLNVLQDPYGNYVVQTALKQTKGFSGGLHKILANRVLLNYAFLHSHPHGKRVLACIKGGRSCVL